MQRVKWGADQLAAEIIPKEPDAGNAAGGRNKPQIPFIVRNPFSLINLN